jgi:hypothetical protein
LQSLPNILYAERKGMWLCKRKKRKNGQVYEVKLGAKAHLKKRKKKIKVAHVFLQLFSNPNERNVFKRAKVELELDTLYTPI